MGSFRWLGGLAWWGGCEVDVLTGEECWFGVEKFWREGDCDAGQGCVFDWCEDSSGGMGVDEIGLDQIQYPDGCCFEDISPNMDDMEIQDWY